MGELIHSSFIQPLRKKFIILRAHTRSNEIALTFDDGPNRTYTSKLLALLRQENTLATFFLLGSCVEKHPHLVQEIALDGHDIGIHAFTHRTMEKIGFWRYAREIDKTAWLIYNSTRRMPRIFRPPYGEYDMRLLWLMIAQGLRCILWSIDHHDYNIKDKDVLVRLIKNTKLASGDILLFHDHIRATIEAIPEIIRDIKSRGFTLVTVSQLLKKSTKHEKDSLHGGEQMMPLGENP